ncbi:MAG: sulfurtransferase TusB [Methylococcaceae bacterium]|nr:sulfurtransferase TusB [Methylococcaceae bacterium]
MLHLVSQAPLRQEIVERIVGGDDVVLQRGTVWAALSGHADNAKLLQLLAKSSRIYVLREMLEVNGIESSRVLEGVNIIDYSGLVDLTVKNPLIHTWC